MFNKRFLYLLRQLRDLENVQGRDYSEQIERIAYDQVIALENAGMTPTDALNNVQIALNNERLRYPIELQPLVG